MGVIKIPNTDWDAAKNKNNTKHRGEGVATENYNDEILALICALIEAFLQQKYSCFKDQLTEESARKNAASGGATGGGDPVGPGRIGKNDGSPGYTGGSNLYVGVPDPDAIELTNEIEKLKNDRISELEREDREREGC